MTMTVKELYDLVADNKIISDIELQRAIVYDADKQQSNLTINYIRDYQ